MASPRRTLFVGDVHGCADELDALLVRTHFDPAADRLVLVGDLVARGPDSARAVRIAARNHALCVTGNHDWKVLLPWRVANGRLPHAGQTVHVSQHHRDAAEQLSEDDFAWLDARPLQLPIPEHGVRVVHAGLDPSVPVDAQDPFLVMNIRSIDGHGKATRDLLDTPWASRWHGPEHVIFGHDARRALQFHPFATGLDSGCCYGRRLTALVLDAGEPVPSSRVARQKRMVHVDARRAYCPMGDGRGPE